MIAEGENYVAVLPLEVYAGKGGNGKRKKGETAKRGNGEKENDEPRPSMLSCFPLYSLLVTQYSLLIQLLNNKRFSQFSQQICCSFRS